jgi:NADPH:quinone reductase-like Zn-dependent oxidoreductase
MKAVRFHEFGGPEVLRYEDVDRPRPAAGQVLVRVAATSFNPVDAAIRSGFLQQIFAVALPHIPGIDVAGTVAEIGEGVAGWSVGEAVVGFLPMTEDGASAEFVLAPAELLTGAPTSIPLVDAAALPSTSLTAWQALFEQADLKAGQRVLVNGAGEGSAATRSSSPSRPGRQ